MALKMKPVTIWGIEFDALIDESKTLSSTIPIYPVEKGFPVSDTIINDPVSLQLTLYVSNTPVTWLYRHGSSTDRIIKICNLIEKKWEEKKLTKIVTSDTIYKDFGITSISIKKSREIGYAREISITAQKVRKTKKKTVKIPSYILKSGKTMANAGIASTSMPEDSQTGSGSEGAGNNSGTNSGTGAASGNSGNPGNSGSSGSGSGGTAAGTNHSILYGIADGLGFI